MIAVANDLAQLTLGNKRGRGRSLRLPVPELRQRLFGVVDIVQLEQVEPVGLEPSQRALQLRCVWLLQLGGDEDAVAQAAYHHDVSQHGFGLPVG